MCGNQRLYITILNTGFFSPWIRVPDVREDREVLGPPIKCSRIRHIATNILIKNIHEAQKRFSLQFFGGAETGSRVLSVATRARKNDESTKDNLID